MKIFSSKNSKRKRKSPFKKYSLHIYQRNRKLFPVDENYKTPTDKCTKDKNDHSCTTDVSIKQMWRKYSTWLTIKVVQTYKTLLYT